MGFLWRNLLINQRTLGCLLIYPKGEMQWVGTHLIPNGRVQYWRETFLTVPQENKFASLTRYGSSKHGRVHGTRCWQTRHAGAHMLFSRSPKPAWATWVPTSKNLNRTQTKECRAGGLGRTLTDLGRTPQQLPFVMKAVVEGNGELCLRLPAGHAFLSSSQIYIISS